MSRSSDLPGRIRVGLCPSEFVRQEREIEAGYEACSLKQAVGVVGALWGTVILPRQR
jgi:hypothetical protein